MSTSQLCACPKLKFHNTLSLQATCFLLRHTEWVEDVVFHFSRSNFLQNMTSKYCRCRLFLPIFESLLSMSSPWQRGEQWQLVNNGKFSGIKFLGKNWLMNTACLQIAVCQTWLCTLVMFVLGTSFKKLYV